MAMTKTPPGQAAVRQARWGDAGVSERMVVQDGQLSASPRQQQITLEDAGILSELAHHVYVPDLTLTPGTGTATKDPFGPYDLLNWYIFQAGANTPLVSLSGLLMGALQTIEYPGRNWEADADPTSVQAPLTNVSDFFNFPAATAIMRYWARVPLALRWVGMPGGMVGYIVLQNKRIQNIIKPTYNLTGAAAPYSLAGATGQGAYNVTGPGTVTGSPIMETWKTLHTVPNAKSKMPLFGFTRYISEIQVPYSGGSFKYNYEPGGILLRALFWFLDGGVTPLATASLSTLTFQYGTNKQLDIWTPYRNLQQQLELYGRTLPQGCYALDYYTAKRNTVDAKSTENTSNVQTLATFASGYAPAANSQVRILLDKVFVVQNYLKG